jgi:hypothetical protein
MPVVSSIRVVGVRSDHRRALGWLMAICAAGCALTSCSKYETFDARYTGPQPIPLPKRALLERAPEPKCAAVPSASDGRAGQLPELQRRWADLGAAGASDLQDSWTLAASQSEVLAQAGSNAELSQRIKLEYERDCFRRAEARTREKLLELQKAVGATVRAVKRAGLP